MPLLLCLRVLAVVGMLHGASAGASTGEADGGGKTRAAASGTVAAKVAPRPGTETGPLADAGAAAKTDGEVAAKAAATSVPDAGTPPAVGRTADAGTGADAGSETAAGLTPDAGTKAADGGAATAADGGAGGTAAALARGKRRISAARLGTSLLNTGGAAGKQRAASAAKKKAAVKAKAKKVQKAKKAKKALKVMDKVHEYGAKTVRRLKRVENLLAQGNVAAARAELARAKRAASNAVDTTQEFAEEEELTAVDYLVRVLLTLGVAFLAFLLIWALTFLIRRLVTRAVGADAVGGGLRWAFRLLVLVVSVGVLATSTWIVLRMVWKLRISGARFFEAVSQPLFAFEGRPVTPLSLLFFLLTLGAIIIFSRTIRRLLEHRVLPRFSQDIGIQHAFSAILHYLIIFLGLLLSLEVLGVGASTVAIVAGVVGLGIGFGMQHIINNFLSGFVLFFERPVKVGDVVDVAGLEGRVERIQARATTMVTCNHTTVVVPNSDFVQGRVTNLSHPDEILRTRVRVGVSYASDVDQVRDVLLGVAAAHADVLAHKPASVHLVDFADSSINFDLIFWVSDILFRERILSEIRFGIAHAFREHGIQIPFPQRDTNLKPTPELIALLNQSPKPDEK